MAEKLDHLKGKAKEKAGQVTDDRGLERQGKLDQIASNAKTTVDHAADAVKHGADKVSDSAAGR